MGTMNKSVMSIDTIITKGKIIILRGGCFGPTCEEAGKVKMVI